MVGAFAFGRAIWQHYLDTGGALPFASVDDGHDLHHRYLAQAPAGATLRDWWTEHLGKTPDGSMLPADTPCGDNTHGSTHEVEAVFDSAETVAITDAVSALGTIGLYDVVAASLYRCLAEVQGQDAVTVAHRINGRNVLPEKIYFDSIDCFAYNVPLRLTMGATETLAQTARQHHALQARLPFKGYSYDAVGAALPASHWPASRVTAVRLNFLGEARTPQNSAVRFVPNASSGRIAPAHGQRGFALDCVVQLRQGRLVLTAQYSENLYQRETVQAFLTRMTDNLRAFASSPSEKDLTHAA